MPNMDLNNATPRHLSTGAQDNSARALPSTPVTFCQHIPLYFIFSNKGQTEKFYGKAAEQESMFGREAFNLKSKYATHHIRLRNFLNTVGVPSTAAVIQRLIPKDIKTKANISLYLDVLETKVPRYSRTSNGSDFIDPVTGEKELIGYVPGYKIKWYRKSLPVAGEFGSIRVENGTMVKWMMDETPESKEVHVLTRNSNDIANTTNGHTAWADKTVYVYNTDADMFNPRLNSSKREKYVVDANGNAKFETEQTFGVDADTVINSKLYPILESKAAYEGSWYNQVGFSIQSPSGVSKPSEIMEKKKHMAYNLYIYQKATPQSQPVAQRNVFGDNSSQFTFEYNGVNPFTDANMGFESVTRNLLFNTRRGEGKRIIYPTLEGIYFYRENFEELVTKFNETEIPYITQDPEVMRDGIEVVPVSWYDHRGMNPEELVSEAGLINPFTCKSTNLVNYISVCYDLSAPGVKDNNLTEINMINNTPIFLERGEDGTMNQDTFEELVREYMQRYLNEDDIVNDLGNAVETHLYDTGFDLETKEVLPNFIAYRKDTNLIGTPFTFRNRFKPQSLEDQANICSKLVAASRLYPESDEYGTRCIRSTQVIGDGIAFIETGERDPLVFEIAAKTAKLLGGENGKWQPGYIFDSGDSNRINYMVDPTPKFISPTMQERLKKTGVNYIRATNGGNEFFFPMLQTVYPDSTSIANSFVNSLTIGALERCAYRVWTELTGDIKMNNEVFAERGRAIAEEMIQDIFGGLITVYADFIITQPDAQRGFSWHLEYKIYGNVMKTVQLYTSRLYRMSDLDDLVGSNS